MSNYKKKLNKKVNPEQQKHCPTQNIKRQEEKNLSNKLENFIPLTIRATSVLIS